MSKTNNETAHAEQVAHFGPLLEANFKNDDELKATSKAQRAAQVAGREEGGKIENRLVVEIACWNAETKEVLDTKGKPKNCPRKKARVDFFAGMQAAKHISKSQKDRLIGRVKQIQSGSEHAGKLLKLDKKGAPDLDATVAALEEHKIVTRDDLRAHFAAPKPTGIVAADADDAKAGSKSFQNRSAVESQTPWELRAAATKAFQAGWDATCKDLGVNVTALRKAAKKTNK